MQVTSPQFSNSSKCNLSSLISPTRNKRIVSAQHCCSSLQTNRNNSCKKLDSPSKVMGTKPRKKSQIGHTKTKSKDFVVQINALKEEYFNLKTAYRELLNDKVQQNQKEGFIEEQNKRLGKQNQNLKGKVSFLQSEVERIKRESIKLVQIWQFRVKAVEQNLHQKEKMIENFRQCLRIHGIDQPRSSTKLPCSPKQSKAELNGTLSALNDSLIMANLNGQSLSNISQHMSLSIDSIQDQSIMAETVIHRQLQVSANVKTESGLVDITNRADDGKKAQMNFKKVRKELSKKIEVNVEEKHKDLALQVQPRTPMDRKVAKQSKVPKIKLKKEEDYVESKSSKKKMSAR